LPEAQLDRFLMRIDLGYPSREEEISILERFQENDPLENLPAVLSPERICEMQKLRAGLAVSGAVRAYIADIAAATRSHKKVRFGVSPRGAIGMMKAAQALALIRGRDFVLPDDIKELARPVLLHRIILLHEERTRGVSARNVLDEVLAEVPVPVTA
jgi:MoxR-like ATPase